MRENVEALRTDLYAAKNALDAARDAVWRISDAESQALYQAARERYDAALRRFSARDFRRPKPKRLKVRHVLETDNSQSNPHEELVGVRVGMTLNEAALLLVRATLQSTNGNVSRTAAILGIDRSTVYSKIKQTGS